MKVMLAMKADLDNLRYPLLASPKLDGVRAYVESSTVMARSGKRIPNEHVQSLFGRRSLNGLDGELIVGSPTDKNAFNNTSGAVRKLTGEPDVCLHCFDVVNEQMPFRERLEMAEAIAAELGGDCVRAVPHTLIRTRAELDAYEQRQVEAGYEGIMLRDPEGPYKHGRSTQIEGWLLKVKRFEDAEGTIIGCVEEMHNGNEAVMNELGRMKRSSHKENKVAKGTLGALTVLGPGGKEFNLGTGFSAALRKELWTRREKLVGLTVKFKYQLHGTVDRPRIPVFVGFRDRWDL